MKSILIVIFSFLFIVSGFSQTRNVVVGTNDVIVQPTNFWSANASNGRTGLGLGSAATNPASAFQPSSSVLSNLASSNGSSLTNIAVSNVIGALATNGSAANLTNFPANLLTTNGNATNLTNFPASLLRTNGNGFGLTNLNASNITGIIPASNISTLNLTNIGGTLAIASGGTGATNAGAARTNLGLGATNDLFIGLSVGANNTNLSTNDVSLFGQQNYADTSARESFVFGAGNSISNMPNGIGGSIVMGILGNMTNQGAFLFNGVPQGGTVGNSRGNNTFAVNASNGIYLNGSLFLEAIQGAATDSGILAIGAGGTVSRTMTNKSTATPAFFGWDGFVNTAFSAAQARTNIGLSFAALTNTNTSGFNVSLYGTNTNPVLVNSNGEVVSPTNFWQVAPIQTVVQNLAPITNSTNAATNARNLYVYSLATNITGVTNTVTLPTNTSTFAGDSATIIHQGPTSSVTAVRQAGAGSNLITINRFDESVKFIYENNSWTTYHNISFQEPIYFSGTNVSANAATSRTNLGLGAANDVVFNSVQASEIKEANGTRVLDLENFALTFGTNYIVEWSTNEVQINSPLTFFGTNTAATTRTNLGIPLAALTNTSVTNFQKAIFYTNTAPSNIGGNLGTIAAWIEIVASNGVTYKVPAYTNVP